MVRIFCSITVLAILAVAAAAQETPHEFWPEAQLYANLGDRFRLRALVTRTKARESDKFTEATFEVDIDVGLKAILRRVLAANPNTERGKYLTLRLGYVHVAALNDEENPSSEHRGILELNARYPLPGSLLLSDRSRGEARWINGRYSLRYRNRLRLERDFRIQWFRFTPYTTGEVYYDTRYRIWNRNEYSFGTEVPIRRHAIIEFYFMRQNTSQSSTPHINGFGLVFQWHL
ncbi:MAG TPA: DUF2490 domain-containing protein [Pyrinomonadaceae bacterium]|jgi:hypothetical protein|nr:DUF2490 domain-containing protein [Pyrinomonadaceae bacterium]